MQEKDNIIKEIFNYTTYKNPNNFDDYFSLVLPTLSNSNPYILFIIYR